MTVDLVFKDPVRVTASEDAEGFVIEVTPEDFLRYITKFDLTVIVDGAEGRSPRHQKTPLRVHDRNRNCIVTKVNAV